MSVNLIREALIEELQADSLYERIEKDPAESAEVKEIIREIRSDEQNHIGQLLALYLQLSGEDTIKNVDDGLHGRD